ncbi:E3 ubiquitin-protein ligase TRIM62-like [Rhinoderma darwinii]|uniref:E3 ubiquitin-protein ligase TRIM62-like n=1 Tax=Rhinoderma darwinii TaxID=43563 RepID=UPI003F66B017
MALLRDELSCSICLNVYTDPVMLNCGHNFCQECIGRALDTNNGSRTYTCPECRAEFQQRPVLLRNLKLCNIIQHLQEASRKKLQHSLLDLTTKIETTERKVESLKEQKSKIQETSDALRNGINSFFKVIIKEMKTMRKAVLSEISRKKGHALMKVSKSIQELEIKKDELSRKIRETQEMLRVADPITVLRQAPEIEDRRHPGDSEAIYLDETPINFIIKKCLSSMIGTLSELINEIPCPKSSDILLDVATACNYILVSRDRKSATHISVDQGYLDRPERFMACQVLSTCSFSSGRHYWEVDVNKAKEWIIGVAHHNMDRKTLANNAYIGYNDKSWGLEYRYCLSDNRYCLSAHHNDVTEEVTFNFPVDLLGVYLNYDSGLISFYQLGDPIRHLYSFSATFTESLHAAFYVFPDSCIKIR